MSDWGDVPEGFEAGRIYLPTRQFRRVLAASDPENYSEVVYRRIEDLDGLRASYEHFPKCEAG